MNEFTIITPEESFELLVATLTAISAGGLGGAPITTTLVALIKRVPQLEKVPAPLINLITGLILTLAVWIAAALSFEPQLKDVFDVIVVVAPALISLITTVSGSHVLYQTANKSNVPLFGHSRTTPASVG